MCNSHNILDGTVNDFEGSWRRLDIILKYIFKYFMKLLITNYSIVGFCDHYCLVRGEDFLKQLNTYNPFKASLQSYDPRKKASKICNGGFPQQLTTAISFYFVSSCYWSLPVVCHLVLPAEFLLCSGNRQAVRSQGHEVAYSAQHSMSEKGLLRINLPPPAAQQMPPTGKLVASSSPPSEPEFLSEHWM